MTNNQTPNKLQSPIKQLLVIGNFIPFTPLESPAIYGGDDIDKASIPYRKGGV
jgi:hypothetical protein